MVQLLTTIICFITAVLSFQMAPPLVSKTNIHRTLTTRKSYSLTMSNLYLNPFSSPSPTGKSLLNGNVQYDAPNIPFTNEPIRGIQSYLINRTLFPREQDDLSASVGSSTDPFNMNERTAMKRQSPGEL